MERGEVFTVVIEATSPSTARGDRLRKRVIYQDQLVQEYWLVDVDARVVERWRPDDTRPEILADYLTPSPKTGIPPLTVVLAEIFA